MNLVEMRKLSWMIGIPSTGRGDLVSNNKGPLRFLPFDKYKNRVNIFIKESENDSYKTEYTKVLCQPKESSDSIAKQQIIEYAVHEGMEYVFLVDDDIVLSHRRTDDLTKFKSNLDVPGKTEELIETCLRICGPEFPIVHPRFRFHANTAKYRYEFNCPGVCFVCLHIPTLIENHFDYLGNGPLMGDRFLHHSLLEKGMRSVALGQFTVDDGGPLRKGGCSEYRTTKLQSECAIRLAKRFPDTIRLKVKHTKGWKETRYDCVQFFKKYLKKGDPVYMPKAEMEANWSKKYGD